jgi:AraC family transcriptional regulator
MRVDPMLTNSLATNLVSPIPFRPLRPRSPTGVVLSTSPQNDGNGPLRALDGGIAGLTGLSTVDAVEPKVEISPAEIVRRRLLAWGGVAGEVIHATQRERVAFRYQGPLHLLAVYDQGARSNGDAFVQGLPRSSLRDLNRKLTFVPTGHEYRESHESRTFARIIFYYFNPSMLPADPQIGGTQPAPRLHFEDATLLDTVIKLAAVIESTDADDRVYVEALGTVLASGQAARARRGISAREDAPRCKRLRPSAAKPRVRLEPVFAREMQDHAARASPFYFCRAFKHSFGIPPHRATTPTVVWSEPRRCSPVPQHRSRKSESIWASAKRARSQRPSERQPGSHRRAFSEALPDFSY